MPLRGQYGTAQLNDQTLTNALRNVRVVKEVHKDQGHLTFPYFAVKNGLLYWVKKSGEDVQEQLLVHKSHRSTVLHLKHTHLLGAHLGVDKIKERILQHFFFFLVRHLQRGRKLLLQLSRMSTSSTKTHSMKPPNSPANHWDPVWKNWNRYCGAPTQEC